MKRFAAFKIADSIVGANKNPAAVEIDFVEIFQGRAGLAAD